MSKQLELLVTEGPLKGRRFGVPADGLRLGRSSSCEISIPDPALSRNHCLFETRDGGLWVTDLASANGTVVNEEQLGSDSRILKPGDMVFVGESALRTVAAGEPAADSAAAQAAASALPKIDLGLGGGESSPEGAADVASDEGGARSQWLRYVLWGVALLLVLAAALLILQPVATEADVPVAELPAGELGELVSFTYEKVHAGPHSAFRYAVAYDGASKSLHVNVNEVPSGRGVTESAKLSDEECARLANEVLSDAKLYGLSPAYTGSPSEPGALKSYVLHVVRGRRVLDVSVENASEPEEFQDARIKLEAFVNSKLNLHAIQMPVERLQELSAEARRVADAKWDERKSRFGNYAEALRKYDEAINYLKTLDPKPPDYERVREQRRMVKDEQDRVFTEYRIQADQYIGTQNWEKAKEKLHILLELVDDPNDERNKETSRKLLEVEARMREKR